MVLQMSSSSEGGATAPQRVCAAAARCPEELVERKSALHHGLTSRYTSYLHVGVWKSSCVSTSRRSYRLPRPGVGRHPNRAFRF